MVLGPVVGLLAVAEANLDATFATRPAAISALVSPSASNRSTSRSRAVSLSSVGSGPASGS